MATLLFLASSIAFAIAGLQNATTRMPAVEDFSFTIPFPDWAHELPGFEPRRSAPFGEDLMVLARPDNAALWVLLASVWVATTGHAIRVAVEPSAAEGIGATAASAVSVDQFTLAAALVAMAGWPWLGTKWPVAAVLGSAAAAVLGITAALGFSGQAHPARVHDSIGLIAGWTTVAVYVCLGQFAALDLGLSSALAAVLALILMLLTAVEVQLRIGPRIGFSLAIICAMIGYAAHSIGQDVTGTILAIVAIAVMAAVMVRVLS